MLGQDDLCAAVLDNLTLDFMGYGLREVQLTKKNSSIISVVMSDNLKSTTLSKKDSTFFFSLKPTDTIHQKFILNMHGPVAEILEAKFKAEELLIEQTLAWHNCIR